LAVDVKCGTPVLEMKNYCRSYGADVLYSKVYTSDIKYYADNISIADEVICGNPETLISSENNKFDFIIVGRPLNSYNNPFGFLKNLISKLGGSGYIIFCVRNANDARSFLSMLNVNIGSQPIEIKAVNYSDFLDKLSEYGCTNADIHTTSLPADKKLKETIAGLVISMNINGDKDSVYQNIMTEDYWITAN